MDFDAQPVLLIEDNEDDAFIFGRAFKKAQLRHPLHCVQNGQQAIDYLSGKGEFADRSRFPLPFLVLLDLKLPLRNGLDVLEWIAGQPAIATIPVVVLTSSAEQRDIRRARELGARAYLVKPPAPRTLSALFSALRRAADRGNAGTMPSFDGDLLRIGTSLH